jgi:hypothetical protein
MPATPSKMLQQGSIGAAGVLKSVRKDREADSVKVAGRQDTLFVGRCGQAGHGRREPSGIEGDGTERAPEEVMN